MNYFEHDVKVKFFDGILEHSCEWQWFINYIEKEFKGFKDITNFQDFLNSYSETNDFLNVVDFFFVYQSMYNGNCLNIRNECAHGREYISSNSLFFGFKTTLICLKLILDRIDQVKNIEKSFGNQNS